MENGRCRHHGGLTPRGFALPQTKTGRWSKDLPTRLASRYAAALADGDLLALRDEVGILDMRLGELLSRVDSGEAGGLWRSLRDAKATFLADRDNTSLMTLLALIDRGAGEASTWREIFDVIEQRRKVVESERKRLVEMHQMMTTEQAMLLLAAVTDTIRRHVTDRDALGAISRDISGLLAR
jgi:hypothetical protein